MENFCKSTLKFMQSGDTQAQRTEKFLSIPSAPLFVEDLFWLNPKKAVHLPALNYLLKGSSLT